MKDQRTHIRRTPRAWLLWAALLVACAGLGLMAACGGREADENGDKIVINYWEKWTNFEADAMQAVVDRFNAAEIRNADGRIIQVNYLSTSQIDRKLLLATAGGNPPDVAGFWSEQIAIYAEKGALIPLNGMMERDGIELDAYLPAVQELLHYRGFVWALPTTPATLALHYNRTLFEEAGLDPDRPPRTIAELDEYARRLTRTDEEGDIIQLGFAPPDPGWWNSSWGYWFGAQMIENSDTVNATSPEMVASLEWVQGYPETYGRKELDYFLSSARAGGQLFDSPENLFIAGKLAMQIQGVWMSNFIEKHNPDLDWAAAPFPSVSADMEDVTLINSDILIIPKGSKNIEEAWAFIKFVQRQDVMESLCLGQKKFSPLRDVSPGFYEGHPNSQIRIFRRLAESPNARSRPKTPIFSEYDEEMFIAFENVWLGRSEPIEALRKVKERVQPKLDRHLAKWSRIAEERIAYWKEML